MHSTAQIALAALEIFNETDSTGDACIRQRKTAPAASEIFNETVSTGDECIRQRKQPLWP
jgi:hypothetical protein